MDSAVDAIIVPPAQPRLGINYFVVRQALFGDGDIRKLKLGTCNMDDPGVMRVLRTLLSYTGMGGGGGASMVDGPCRRVPT